jgi:hypothetical protein
MVALACVGIDACSEPFVRVGSDSSGGTGNQTASPMGGTTYTTGTGGTVPDAGEGGQDAAAATFGHFPLASVGPLVRGVAAVARDADSILVLGEIRETPWLSLRRIPHGSQDWSEEWGSLPLTTAPVPPSSLGAARLGQGVGVYYPGSLLRFDEGGQVIGTPEAVPEECTVSPGGDSVWLACVDVGVGITLRTCPAAAECSDPVLLEPMSQYTGTPVAVGERDPIQVIYELSEDGVEWTLRRAFVDRATLTLQEVQTLTAQPFAPGPFSSSLPGLATPAALALPDRLLVAYGIPHQFGVWDDSGSQLFSAAPEDSFAVRRRFSPFAGVAQDLYTVETSWADLGDEQSRATRLFRISRTSLELTDSTVLIAADPPSDSSGDVLADPDAPTAVWLRSEGYPWSPLAGDALRAPLTGQSLANLEPSVAVGELRGLLPRLLACDALGCTLLVERHLVTLGTPGKVLGLLTLDRAHGSVELPSSGVTDWGMDDPLRVEGGKTFLTRGMCNFPLWAFDRATGNYTELSPGADHLLEAFVEGDGLRVFVLADSDQVIEQGLVAQGTLGQLTPVSHLDFAAMVPQRGIDESPIARCAGKYTSLMTDPSTQAISVYQMDPGTESDFSLVTTLSPSESVWFWRCTDAAFYLALSDTIAVFRLDGGFLASVPALADGALLSTATTADQLYLLWGFGLDGSVASTPRFALTSVSGDGSVTEQELALPPGRQARISGFFYDRVPLDVSDDEVRVAWVADDGTPFISIWPR